MKLYNAIIFGNYLLFPNRFMFCTVHFKESWRFPLAFKDRKWTEIRDNIVTPIKLLLIAKCYVSMQGPRARIRRPYL